MQTTIASPNANDAKVRVTVVVAHRLLRDRTAIRLTPPLQTTFASPMASIGESDAKVRVAVVVVADRLLRDRTAIHITVILQAIGPSPTARDAKVRVAVVVADRLVSDRAARRISPFHATAASPMARDTKV